MAKVVTSEFGHTSIKHNGIEHESIEYITYSKVVKLGLKLNRTDTSFASVSVISDAIPEVTPSSDVMIRKK